MLIIILVLFNCAVVPYQVRARYEQPTHSSECLLEPSLTLRRTQNSQCPRNPCLLPIPLSWQACPCAYVHMYVRLYVCVCVCPQVGYSTPAPWVIDPLNRAIDALFAVDIGLNFRTCYVDASARLVRDGHQIALHYLRTWFAVDLIATIPFDLIVGPCSTLRQYSSTIAAVR